MVVNSDKGAASQPFHPVATAGAAGAGAEVGGYQSQGLTAQLGIAGWDAVLEHQLDLLPSLEIPAHIMTRSVAVFELYYYCDSVFWRRLASSFILGKASHLYLSLLNKNILPSCQRTAGYQRA